LVFALRAGANYVALLSEIPHLRTAGLQPFLLPANESNRQHLVQLQEMMTGLEDAESLKHFERLVDELDKVGPAGRRLDALVDTYYPRDSKARHEIQPWIGKGVHAGVFGGDEDTLQLDNPITMFDFTQVLEIPRVAGPVTFNVWHRIEETCRRPDNTIDPAFIIIEETQPLAQHPGFRNKILKKLQEGGKKRQVVVTVWQRPAAMDEVDPDLGQALRSQCPTWIFFRDPGATKAEYAKFQLTDREWDFIRGQYATHLPRAVLMKRPSQNLSVILDVNMECLGELKEFFRSGNEFWTRALELQASDPDRWHERYLAQTDYLAAREAQRLQMEEAA
jgi:type IV secretory pathway VirB4 component